MINIVDEETEKQVAWVVKYSSKLWEQLCRKDKDSRPFYQAGFSMDAHSSIRFREQVTHLSIVVAAFRQAILLPRQGTEDRPRFEDSRAVVKYQPPRDQGQDDFSDRYLPILLVGCWLASDNDETSHRLLLEFNDIIKIRSLSFINGVVKDSIVVPRLWKPFLRTWNSAVKHSLCDTELATYFATLLLITENRRYSDFKRDIIVLTPMVVANGCKTQLCSGEGDIEVNSRILNDAMALLTFMFDRTILPLERISKLVVETSAIPIISASLVYLAACPLAAGSYKLAVLDRISGLFKVHSQMSTLEGSECISQLKKWLLKYWHSSLDGLRQLSMESYPSRDAIIEEWVKFGRSVNFYDNIRRKPHVEDEDDREYSFKHCYDEDCLCYEKPGSHPMRVCKGCWRTMYCNDRCQRRHWENGHKEACRRRVAIRRLIL